MDRIDAMRVFARVVERGSFVRAAEDLRLPASTATDAVKQLEARLGAPLLARTTRQVRPTPDGEAYYRRCLVLLDDFEEAESAFRGERPRGRLRVEVQGNQARHFIVPGLPRFFAEYPDLEMFMSEGDRFVDLVREGIDCVLRAGPPGADGLVARPVANLAEATLASPGYLARFGTPTRWDALEGHGMIGFHSSASGGILPLEFMVAGRRRTVTLPATLSVDGADTYKAAAMAGLGLIQVPRYAVTRELEEGTLVEVLPESPPAPLPVHLLYPPNRQLNLRVRVFIDWVAREYARQ